MATEQIRLAGCYTALNDYVQAIGLGEAAAITGVSTDTMRRRVRGEQPWQFTEVFTLAIAEAKQSHRKAIIHGIIEGLTPTPEKTQCHPLLLPNNLRAVLVLVGKLTTEIAESLQDGRVDSQEADRLLDLFCEMEELTSFLRRELQNFLAQERKHQVS